MLEDPLDDDIYSGALSTHELVGWSLFVLSLLLWLVHDKLAFQTQHLGLAFMFSGFFFIVCGAYFRLKGVRKSD